MTFPFLHPLADHDRQGKIPSPTLDSKHSPLSLFRKGSYILATPTQNLRTTPLRPPPHHLQRFACTRYHFLRPRHGRPTALTLVTPRTIASCKLATSVHGQ